MSRIGLKPISLPEGVTYEMKDGVILVKGPKGEVSVNMLYGVSVQDDNGTLHCVLDLENDRQAHKNHGTFAANLNNAIKGVHEGWKKELEINGTGYRASIKGNAVCMFLGYSHEVRVEPVGKYTKITCQDDTHLTVEGCDKHDVGQTAALIYDSHRPDVYGQKGVHYKGQMLIKKVGKRAAAGGKK
ncbi:MAG: 50S ribosomal protein L6 [Bacilli bacterium]|nr:50S ribosomal protein L6 [Bacilli bacterium]